MKTLAQSRPIVAKLTSLSLIAGVSFAGILGFSEKASAYHKTNRPEVEQSLASGGWTVIYSKEFSHAEYMKLAAAIAADVVVSKGGATSVYFEGFAVDSLQKVIQGAKAKAPKMADILRRELTVNKLLSAIRASFNGKQVRLSMAGTTLEVGRATYNRAECLKVFKREKCVSTPNTYQPYIRFRV
ncbi:MAG TPA: hypothetical protein V6D18_07180 [Thermosynechococcaceae cyanobacterium]